MKPDFTDRIAKIIPISGKAAESIRTAQETDQDE